MTKISINSLLGPQPEWKALGNCVGVNAELFYPERGASTREAKAVCDACVVREECLEFAVVNGEKFGIWGGLSERQRRPLRRARALAEANNVIPIRQAVA